VVAYALFMAVGLVFGYALPGRWGALALTFPLVFAIGSAGADGMDAELAGETVAVLVLTAGCVVLGRALAAPVPATAPAQPASTRARERSGRRGRIQPVASPDAAPPPAGAVVEEPVAVEPTGPGAEAGQEKAGAPGRTRAQLYDEARRRGISGRSRMSKAELERAVTEREAGEDDET
jgi:hypothetical protein